MDNILKQNSRSQEGKLSSISSLPNVFDLIGHKEAITSKDKESSTLIELLEIIFLCSAKLHIPQIECPRAIPREKVKEQVLKQDQREREGVNERERLSE